MFICTVNYSTHIPRCFTAPFEFTNQTEKKVGKVCIPRTLQMVNVWSFFVGPIFDYLAGLIMLGMKSLFVQHYLYTLGLSFI